MNFPAARSHETKSASRAAALGLTAAIMIVPANLLPVISTEAPTKSRTDTIFSGIQGLFQQGMWGIGIIVFIASILVPFLKLAGLAGLLIATRRGPPRHPRFFLRLYETLDFIGRWSMLDVFLVAFLSGLVQLGTLATVRPHSGIIAFAAVVVLTMLATRAFDPRTLSQQSPASPA